MGALGLGRIETGQAQEYPYRGRLIAWLVFDFALTFLNWASRLSSGTPKQNIAYDWSTAIGSVIQFAFLLFILGLIARGRWELLALRRPRSWWRALGQIVVLLIVVDIVSAALDPLLHPGREQGLTPSTWEPGHAAAFAVFAFAVVIMAPVTEELAYRGIGFGLLRPFSLALSIGGTAVLWALAHGLLDALPVIILLGIGLAWIRYRQDSTIPGMLAHASFNGIALAASLLK